MRCLNASTNRSATAAEEANRIAALKAEQKANRVRPLGKPFLYWYLRCCSTERAGYMWPAAVQTEFASLVQGLTGEDKTTRCLDQLKQCSKNLPDGYSLRSLDAKDCFLKALTMMNLSHTDTQETRLYFSSEFPGIPLIPSFLLLTKGEIP